MKLMVGRLDGTNAAKVWRVTDDHALNLTDADGRIGADLMGLCADPALIEVARAASGEAVDLARITPDLPIARPGAFFCLGRNFAAHAAELGNAVDDYPTIFMRGPASLTSAGGPMVVPAASEELDYEGEVVAIIGKSGRNIDLADAEDHIFGYTCFNDGSVRDFQWKGGQFTQGKNFDATGALGPVTVTRDDLPSDLRALTIETRLNGVVMQSASTSDMITPPAQAVALISDFATLNPGDMIALGTPQGVGAARTPPVWMAPGDRVEVMVEGIGTLVNDVVSEEAARV